MTIWSAAGGDIVGELRCPSAVKQAALLSLDQVITLGRWRRGLLWTRTRPGDFGAVPITSDGRTLAHFDAFGVATDGESLTLVHAIDWSIWERSRNVIVKTHQSVEGERLAYLDGLVGVSADGSHCYLYWDDSLVFDAQTGALVSEGPRRHPARVGALSNDGRRLFIGTEDGTVMAIDPRGDDLWQIKPAREEITQVVLSPDSALVGWLDRAGGCGFVDGRSGARSSNS